MHCRKFGFWFDTQPRRLDGRALVVKNVDVVSAIPNTVDETPIECTHSEADFQATAS
jgi:hypothetical protein